MRGVLIIAGCLLVAVVAYNLVYPTFSFHVRMTVVVDDNGHETEGSSVIGFSVVTSPTLGGILRGYDVYSKGEAVFIGLSNGRNLLALLGLGGFSRDDISTITNDTFFDKPKASDYGTLAYGMRIVAANLDKPVTLKAPHLPTLVHFRDLSDRNTIETVDPNNLEAALGPGAKIVRISLEITDAPISWGVIKQRLPWLQALIGKDPMDHLPIYYVNKPEIGQDSIFFTGFWRDY